MNYIIENVPLLAIALIIVVIQYKIYKSTIKKIDELNSVLSIGKFRKIQLSDSENMGTDPLTVISIEENENEVTSEIEKSLNNYLINNKGAVSDFNLIKDVVERNCDALNSEIDSQVSMPLYLGLIGTVAGIVIGLGSLALQGQNLSNPSSIMALMMGVAFAMIASGMGIVFTSLLIWKNKKCSASLEKNKNRFYTWIQTQLLPVLSSSTVSTLALLEKNLTNFNTSFSKIVVRLEKRLSNIGDLYEAQIELLERLEKIDVHKMATANLKILETLTRSASQLDNFAKYMDRTTEYLKTVKELNDKIDEHLERTQALATISDFYTKQMAEIELRQNAIRSVATNVDDIVKKALSDLKEHTQTGLEGLQRVYTKQQELMTTLANEQGGALKSTFKKLDAVISYSEQMQKLPQIVTALNNNVQRQTLTTSELANAVKKLGSKVTMTDKGTIVKSSWLSRAIQEMKAKITWLWGNIFKRSGKAKKVTPVSNVKNSTKKGRSSYTPHVPRKIDRV